MNEQEWLQWRLDADKALRSRYTAAETLIIMEWFNRLKNRREIDLIGHDRLSAFSLAIQSPNWNLYNDLMARLWIYAPEILNCTKE